jgi:hypothetical protein
VITNTNKLFIIAVLFVFAATCSHNEADQEGRAIGANTPVPQVQATPSRSFTAADVAKLKWIEGTWRGMDGDKPFFERYRIEETAMVVESLKEDSSADGEPGRFELNGGEFGKGEGEKRSAASTITADSVQFVPAVPGKGNNFRFERQTDGIWHAILEWPATADKPTRQKIYKMERWPAK